MLRTNWLRSGGAMIAATQTPLPSMKSLGDRFGKQSGKEDVKQ